MNSCKKIVVAGGRTLNDVTWAHANILQHVPHKDCYLDKSNTEIVHGGAKGADQIGQWFADDLGIECTVFPADWDRYGKGAGPIRNMEMAKYGDVLVAFWDGESKGTRNMIMAALSQRIEVHVYIYDEERM